jgi:ribosomal protein L11 methyltransferase
MVWKEITFICDRQYTAAFEDYILSLGACSVTYTEADETLILEPNIGDTPLWGKIYFTALFTEDFNINNIKEHIAQQLYPNAKHITFRIFKDEDWERTCMQDFHAIQLSTQLWICPSWEQPPEPNAINIMLDPGLAFGTGSHETTSLCLNWLERNIKGAETHFDIGCGSGILGIAAIKLGAASTVGLDIDPQAIKSTLDNAKNNNLNGSDLSAYISGSEPKDIDYDIITANILASTLIELTDYITQKVKTQGKIALSGILKEQAEEVLKYYSESFEMEKPQYKNEWALLTGTKKC